MYSRSEMLVNQTRYDSINRNKIFSSGKTHSEKNSRTAMLIRNIGDV